MTTLQSGMTAKYDAWNRLVEVKDGEDIIQRNEYDGTNRRIQIFSDFSGSTPGTTQDDYYSGQQAIESRSTEDGQPSGGYQYLWSPRYIDAPLLRDTLDNDGQIVAAERIFYLADANYNVTGLVKYNSGEEKWEVAERYTYTPYGVVTYRNASWTEVGSSANSNTTLYTGRTLDVLTSLYYYRARYYDATLERFLSRDPSGYNAGDINLYRYVGNRPLNGIDPHGYRQIICFCSATLICEFPISTYFTRIIDAPAGGESAACKKACEEGGDVYVQNSWTGKFQEDPRGTSGFKLCARQIQGGDCCDNIAAGIANCCGGAHTYIQYGGVDPNGNPLPGTQGWGIGGGNAGNTPIPELKFHPDVCSELKRGGCILKYGKGAGKSGLQATDAEIIDCISKTPMSKDYGMTTYNCKDWAKEAAAACGLCGK